VNDDPFMIRYGCRVIAPGRSVTTALDRVRPHRVSAHLRRFILAVVSTDAEYTTWVLTGVVSYCKTGSYVLSESRYNESDPIGRTRHGAK